MATETLTAREEIYGGLRIVREDGDRRCYVKIWTGKARRPDYIAFQSAERREQFVADRKASWDYHQNAKAERAAARKAFDATTAFAVGDIIQATWGWEQTNQDFYEVLAVGRQTLTLQEIGARPVPSKPGYSDMSDHVVADRSHRGEITRHRVTDASVKFESFKYGHKWEGRPAYRSWYA